MTLRPKIMTLAWKRSNLGSHGATLHTLAGNDIVCSVVSLFVLGKGGLPSLPSQSLAQSWTNCKCLVEWVVLA